MKAFKIIHWEAFYRILERAGVKISSFVKHNKYMKTISAIIISICLVLSIIWYFKEGGWEPIITFGSLIVTLLGLFFFGNKNSQNKMKQKGGKNSKNYLSARDMTIYNK